MLPTLTVPVVAAPMAGGPTTPELVAAVSQAGGLGFLAAGYKTVEAVRDELAAVRRLSDRPFGVNVFLPGPAAPDSAAVAAYRDAVGPGRRCGSVSSPASRGGTTMRWTPSSQPSPVCRW